MLTDYAPMLRYGFNGVFDLGLATGLEGIVIRKKNRQRFVISLDLVNCFAIVEVEAGDLEPALRGDLAPRT